jgi:DNA-binding NarL/FixJ family response regulator
MSDATTILLVDGNTREREYYADYLHAASATYEVVQAASGGSGLDLCARQPMSCVVLEIDLPDMSGFEVLARLVPRTYHPEIAVIVLTRLSNPFLLELAIKNGALGAFDKKRVSVDILGKTIRNAITTVHTLNSVSILAQ